MKVQLFGRSYGRGFSTLEILIAFAVLTLAISAVIMVVFGNQSIVVDTETNTEALGKAQKGLEDARARAQQDYGSVVSTSDSEASGPLIYTKTLIVTDLTQCKKQAASAVSWTSGSRTLSVQFESFLADIAGAIALGGDCAVDSSDKKWDDPQRFAFDTLNPGKSTAIDVLNQIVYLGQNMKPFLSIADTHGAVLDPNNRQNFFVTFANSFNSDGEVIDEINDIDVVSVDDRVYAYIAMASTTAQLAVIDVTDFANPVLVAKRQLSDVDPLGSYPEGWRLYYYDKKLYITTRETAGPELHVFNVSDPTNPTEDPTNGGGNYYLNTTVNDFVVKDGIAYFADDSDARGELLLFDVSTPSSISEILGARTNFSGDQDGKSVFLIGNKLYFGRQSTTGGPELYILDASDPHGVSTGLPILGAPQEISGDVLDIVVVSRFGFLVSSKTNQEFQVWNISNPSSITLIKKYDFGNIVAGGLDYEPDFIYATGDATPNLQILYSPS